VNKSAKGMRICKSIYPKGYVRSVRSVKSVRSVRSVRSENLILRKQAILRMEDIPSEWKLMLRIGS